MGDLRNTIQEEANVDTNWTEVAKVKKPDSGIEELVSILEHAGDSDLVDFRIRYRWYEENPTKFATMKTVTGRADTDDAYPTRGERYGAQEIVVEAKAQTNTADVRVTLLLMNA